MNKTRGLTLIELILSCVLCAIVILAIVVSALMIATMQKDANIKIDADMEWLTADAHLKSRVHSSAYASIENNGQTLKLYCDPDSPLPRRPGNRRLPRD